MAAQVVPSLTRWFTPAALALDGWGVRYARERVLRDTPADWAAAWRAFKGLGVQGRLAGFAPPTLVLAGELDTSTTPEIMGGIHERIPGSTFRRLPGTPHMQTLEQPQLVAQALGGWLACHQPDACAYRRRCQPAAPRHVRALEPPPVALAAAPLARRVLAWLCSASAPPGRRPGCHRRGVSRAIASRIAPACPRSWPLAAAAMCLVLSRAGPGGRSADEHQDQRGRVRAAPPTSSS